VILLVYRLAARDLSSGGTAARAVVGPFKMCFDLAQTLTPLLLPPGALLSFLTTLKTLTLNLTLYFPISLKFKP